MSSAAPAQDIDFVYTWVDARQSAALEQRLQHQSDQKDGFANGENRFRDNTELEHSIGSVLAFAPWVRTIYVVAADGQCPTWYDPANYPKVKIVHHSEIFREYEDRLPVFNSHAIESVLHRIPGLSEHFVYFNDDMFLGAQVAPTDFFTPDGHAIVRVSQQITRRWSTGDKSWRVYRGNVLALLEEVHGPCICFNSAHQARPMLKAICEASWQQKRLNERLLATMGAKFRSDHDIAPFELYCNEILLHGRGIRLHEPGFALCLFDESQLELAFAALRRLRPTFYCINDDMKDPSPEHLRRLRRLLASQLPHHGCPSTAARGQPTLGALLWAVARGASWMSRLMGSLRRLGGGVRVPPASRAEHQ